jgi:hypothetical protein
MPKENLMLTFKTLLLREWMQHQRGWLILVGTPFVAMLLALTFGGVHVSADDGPTGVAIVLGGGYMVAITALAWVSAAFQAPGLARRDQQDRSIEFWRSLPVADWQAVAAPVLTLGLLVPLAVMAISALAGLTIAVLVVARIYGFAALGGLPWGELLAAWLAVVPRMLLGVVLASFWASPALLLMMAASAWLKRWGVPALGAVFGLGGLILAKGYGLPQVFEVIQGLSERFGSAMVPLVRSEMGSDIDLAGGLAHLPAVMATEAGLLLSDLASPLSLLVIAISAGCFALIVLGRRKSGE